MTINYQFGDVDAHGAMIRALAGLLEAEHQAIISDVLTASDFWGGAGSAACQGFITQLGRNFQVIYEQANAHGQKVQAAGNNMAQTDSAVGSSWACGLEWHGRGDLARHHGPDESGVSQHREHAARGA